MMLTPADERLMDRVARLIFWAGEDRGEDAFLEIHSPTRDLHRDIAWIVIAAMREAAG